MKQLDSNKLTKQQEFFNSHLPYLATVDENGEPQVGPKASFTYNTLKKLKLKPTTT